MEEVEAEQDLEDEEPRQEHLHENHDDDDTLWGGSLPRFWRIIVKIIHKLSAFYTILLFAVA